MDNQFPPINGFSSLSPSEILYKSLACCFIFHQTYYILSTVCCDSFISSPLIIAMKKSGVPDPVKTNGVTAAPSSPVNPVAQTGVSSADVHTMKSKGLLAASSSPIEPIGKSGASFVPKTGVGRKSPVSSVAKGKAIVSDTVGEVIAFKDLTLGPHEGELRFRLIHFWEAWNSLSKVLIGLELLLIDGEVKIEILIIVVT